MLVASCSGCLPVSLPYTVTWRKSYAWACEGLSSGLLFHPAHFVSLPVAFGPRGSVWWGAESRAVNLFALLKGRNTLPGQGPVKDSPSTIFVVLECNGSYNQYVCVWWKTTAPANPSVASSRGIRYSFVVYSAEWTVRAQHCQSTFRNAMRWETSDARLPSSLPSARSSTSEGTVIEPRAYCDSRKKGQHQRNFLVTVGKRSASSCSSSSSSGSRRIYGHVFYITFPT